MTVHFVLYTKPKCIQCKMTHKVLNSLHIKPVETYHGNPKETNLIDPDSSNPDKAKWSQNKIKSIIKKTGLHSMPIVKVYSDQSGELLDTWGGFKPDRIKKWAKQASHNS